MIELVGRPLHQWDTGRKVRIVPLDDVQIDEVHFANKGDTKALVVNTVVDDSGTTANIPGKLLQTGRDLVVYAVFEEHTEYSKHFSVTSRPKPDDYVYVEEDYYPLKAILDEKVESEEYLGRVADKAAAKVLPVVEEATDRANAATERATQAAASANKAANTANAAAKNVTDSIEIIREIVEDGEDGPPIVCEASGEEITVSDASNRLLRGLSIYGKTTQFTTSGKNLVQQMDVGGNATTNGDTITIGAFGDAYFFVIPYSIPDGTVVTLSFDAGAFSGTLELAIYNELDKVITVVPNSRNTFTFAYQKNIHDGRILVDDRDRTVENVTLSNIQLEFGNTASNYEPYTGGKPSPNPDYPQELVSAGDSGSIAVSITGKNLINPEAYMTDAAHTTLDGDVFTSNFQNGALYINVNQNNGTALPKGTYTATFLPITQGATCAFFVYSAATKEELLAKYGVTAGNASFTFAAEEDFYFAVGGAKPYGYQSYRLQLEAGNTGTAYEPHKQAQTLTVSTPNGLPGIPVTSGGNYTDSNGQQWVCDEIDLARGVYVQRIKRVAFTGQENWVQDSAYTCAYKVSADHLALKGLSSHYKASLSTYDIGLTDNMYFNYTGNHIVTDTRFVNDLAGFKAFLAAEYAAGNPVTALRQLDKPIETPLDTDVLAAYAALHTNKPNTTVLNDAGAGQKLAYVADTKLYIDHKFTEVTNAIVAMGGTI